MKEEKMARESSSSSRSVTPFEKAEANAASFIGGFLFLEKFNEMVEQYQALCLVMDELGDENHDGELREIYLASKKVLEEEKRVMEESFTQAATAWQQRFGCEA